MEHLISFQINDGQITYRMLRFQSVFLQSLTKNASAKSAKAASISTRYLSCKHFHEKKTFSNASTQLSPSQNSTQHHDISNKPRISKQSRPAAAIWRNQAAVDWHHVAPISLICMTHCVYMQGSQTEAQFHSKSTMSLSYVGKFKLNCSINTHLPTHNSSKLQTCRRITQTRTSKWRYSGITYYVMPTSSY